MVEYAEGDGASAFATMLGGLIEANVGAKPDRRADLEAMVGRVGIEVWDIDEAVTLDFRGDRLVVYNGLKAKRRLTLSADSDTVLRLSRLKLGSISPATVGAMLADENLRTVALKLLTRQLTIDGLPFGSQLLTRLARLLSVA